MRSGWLTAPIPPAWQKNGQPGRDAAGLPAALATIVVLSGLIAVLGHFVLPRSAPSASTSPDEIRVTPATG